MDTKPHQERLESYYRVNRSHLQWCFWSSLGALAIGLAVLIAGVWVIIKGNDAVAASIVTIGGVLTQFIGAGFFYLYSKNLKQLNVFYDQLVKLQDTMYAIELVAHLPESRRAPTYEVIIANLITRNEPKTPMSPELVKAYSEVLQGTGLFPK